MRLRKRHELLRKQSRVASSIRYITCASQKSASYGVS